ncbi:hypothetical protein H5410_004908 [Solanum commersonii]|uniref:Uncharacterized protein n=1 Tax=Solanum commersonii TaxID=4109 RepID=A0A9J6A5N7_SOLCO|nr:hypothetical protein H5410_004908 [Solanum commersonii]
MLPSHVSRRFLLSFLRNCYDFNLSKYDEVVVFVDENEERFPIKYLIGKNLLSGERRYSKQGWSFPRGGEEEETETEWFRFVKRRSNTNNTITKESTLPLFID